LSMTYLIMFQKFNTPIAYVLYLVMAFAFIILIIKIYDILKYNLNRFIDSKKILKRYRDDPKLRYKISLFISLGLNFIYAIFKFFTGIWFESLWLVSFAIYYLILVLLRLNIAKCELKKKKSLKDEYVCYKNSGIILLFINLFLTFVNEKFINPYNNIVAISVACYTFYLLIFSIINLVKYRKYKSPLMSAAKVVNVVTSVVSMLSLEIIMLSTFGPEKVEFNEIMIISTGIAISVFIIIISLYMIIKGIDWLNNKDKEKLINENK